MAALKQANPARCTECGHPVSTDAVGTICSECGEPVDKHRLSRLGAETAMALYAASFLPLVVVAALTGMLARVDGSSDKLDAGDAEILVLVATVLSVAAGVIAVTGCTWVTVLLFRKLPRRMRHTSALSVLPFSRMILVCVIVAVASTAIALALWVGACVVVAVA